MKKPKILAISGSPHKNGNSQTMLNSIKDLYPNIDYKLLMLNELNLERCRGCYVCIRKGEKYCPLKDDRDRILKEMEDADGVIFSSPVYVNQITALMKTFIERLGYESHRPRFYGKHAMVAAVCGMFGAKETNQYMIDIFGSMGYNIVSSLEVAIGSKSEKEKKYNQGLIITAVDKLLKSIEKGEKYSPDMGQLVRFNLFKSLAELRKDYFTADQEYYKDKTTLPIEGKINSFKKKIAKKVADGMIEEYWKKH